MQCTEQPESKAKLSATSRDLLGLGEKDKKVSGLAFLFFLHLQ